MPALCRILRLLSITVWVGGLIFFAFILAPTAFQVLPSTHEAGTVVGATLRILNKLGLACGLIFLLSTIHPWRNSTSRGRKLLVTQLAAVVFMIAATLYVQTAIIPAMERDRVSAGGDVDAAPPNTPARIDFEQLHPLSEKVEGAALLLGVAVIILMGFEEPAV